MKNLRKSANGKPRFWTDGDRLRWIVDFSSTNIKKAKLAALQNELAGFLGFGIITPPEAGSVVMYPPGALGRWVDEENEEPEKPLGELNKGTFEFLQDRIRELLNFVVDAKEFRKHREKRAQEFLELVDRGRSEAEASAKIRTRHISPPAAPQILINRADYWPGFIARQGAFYLRVLNCAPGEIFLLRVLLLLFVQQKFTAKIARCGNPECKKIFYRPGKRIYHNDECTRLQTMRNWRADQKNRIKESQYSKKKIKPKTRSASARITKKTKPKKRR